MVNQLSYTTSQYFPQVPCVQVRSVDRMMSQTNFPVNTLFPTNDFLYQEKRHYDLNTKFALAILSIPSICYIPASLGDKYCRKSTREKNTIPTLSWLEYVIGKVCLAKCSPCSGPAAACAHGTASVSPAGSRAGEYLHAHHISESSPSACMK